MASEIPLITDAKAFSALLDKAVSPDSPSDVKALISNLGGGLLRFAEVAFKTVPAEDVLAKHYQRGPRGRGAHFDVYQSDVSRSYPWVAVYNLAGDATVSVADLPSELADDYFERFPKRTEEAIKVVNEYSAMVMDSPDTDVSVGAIGPGSGLIIPQSAEGPHIIHDIVPNDPTSPGQFVKLVVPEHSDPGFHDRFLSKGYLPLGEYVDLSLIESLQNEH